MALTTHTLLLALALGSVAPLLAQAPPTKVPRTSAIDHLSPSDPSVASWRGSEVARRRYAQTPADATGHTERRLDRTDYELYDEQDRLRYRVAADAQDELLETRSYDYDEQGRPTRELIRRRDELTAEEVRHEYDGRGRLVRTQQFRDDSVEPIRTVAYRYTADGIVVEEQVMPDGSVRFVSEQTLREFELASSYGYQAGDGAGAGNVPDESDGRYDNVDGNRGAYRGENSPTYNPATPEAYDVEEEVRYYPSNYGPRLTPSQPTPPTTQPDPRPGR